MIIRENIRRLVFRTGLTVMNIVLRNLVLIALLGVTAGCSTVSFYTQAVAGQVGLLWQRRSLEVVLADSNVTAEVKRKITVAQETLIFAAEVLDLPVDSSYSSYVDTGKRYIVWNVFAAEEFSLDLRTFCYPIAGCVSYRGFFNEEDARVFAAGLENEGLDVFIGGVAAYSTLGWFDDPLLNTFMMRTDEKLSALLFHELAHKVVYVAGDTRFNESFATSVERIALSRWLASRDQPKMYQQHLALEKRSQQVIEMIGETRNQLGEIYQQDTTEELKRIHKQRTIAALQSSYSDLRKSWGEPESDFSEFRFWMQGSINNARLGTVADYNGLVPLFEKLYILEGENLANFIQACQDLTDLSIKDREQKLAELANDAM
jgi:predicted aminopeptidase